MKGLDTVLKSKKLAIIGGGASGLCAAVEAKFSDNSIDVTIFERLPKLGKKILATGNGRCNFANENLSPTHFYGDNLFLRKILTSSLADTENFFRSLGVLSYHEDERIYPRSQQASTIQQTLADAVETANVKIKVEAPVVSLKKSGNGFVVNGEYFDSVIVAGGGKASPVHGTDGSCYPLLEKIGHKKTELYPALCGLTYKDKKLNMLKGVRAECKATLSSNNNILGEESGEIQFTEKAISGIPVMNLSHLVKRNKQLTLTLDLCEEFSYNELYEHIESAKGNTPEKELENVLGGIVNTKLGFAVLDAADIKPHTRIKSITKSTIKKLCDILKSFEIEITGTRDFTNAQITCGGIKTEEIFPETMMSKIIDGLFICGEILDIHGDCGGYNLHLAWTTGRIAGYSAAQYLSK